jgi:hypothetical protein
MDPNPALNKKKNLTSVSAQPRDGASNTQIPKHILGKDQRLKKTIISVEQNRMSSAKAVESLNFLMKEQPG